MQEQTYPVKIVLELYDAQNETFPVFEGSLRKS